MGQEILCYFMIFSLHISIRIFSISCGFLATLHYYDEFSFLLPFVAGKINIAEYNE